MVKNVEIISVASTLVISIIIFVILVQFLGGYVWTPFILTSFSLGFLPPFITSKTKRITKHKTFQLCFASWSLANIILILFAILTFLGFVLTLPVTVSSAVLGSYLAFAIQSKRETNTSLFDEDDKM